MKVGVVRMHMDEFFVPMPMAVRLAWRVVRLMGVPMVLVVGVEVFVLQRFVGVPVLVPLGQMQPDTNGHGHRGDGQAGREVVPRSFQSRTFL